VLLNVGFKPPDFVGAGSSIYETTKADSDLLWQRMSYRAATKRIVPAIRWLDNHVLIFHHPGHEAKS